MVMMELPFFFGNMGGVCLMGNNDPLFSLRGFKVDEPRKCSYTAAFFFFFEIFGFFLKNNNFIN